MLYFAITVFSSAFLLFVVQPMIAKSLLPSFGGTASVWATCLVVFQTLLLAGYSYAHLLCTKLQPINQRRVHLVVLAASLLFLPPVPSIHIAVNSTDSPVWELIRCLFASVGLPFFALSATTPLLMEWFRQSYPDRSPDRLYAFSNTGSLLALIGYPLLLEPNFARIILASSWGWGMGLFALVCCSLAWKTSLKGTIISTCHQEKPVTHSTPFHTKPNDYSIMGYAMNTQVLLWVTLSACGTALLLALTNQISQDVAPMPLLWIAPMSVYLVTFILSFESQRFYRRDFFLPVSFFAVMGLAWLIENGFLQGFWTQIVGYLVVLFCGCIVCHGELYRLRPNAKHLTFFYLSISFGGALGGGFVAILAPVMFKTLLEIPIIAIAISSLVTIILRQDSDDFLLNCKKNKQQPCATKFPINLRWKLALFGTVILAATHSTVYFKSRKDSVICTRNFYGAYRVTESFLDLKYTVE